MKPRHGSWLEALGVAVLVVAAWPLAAFKAWWRYGRSDVPGRRDRW